MCDCYGHGFYWTKNDSYVVMLDYELNSHTSIKEKRPQLIPAEAISCGFDPINGKAVGKNSVPVPIEVQEKIHFIMETDFPTRDSISQWIRHNYAKNNDKENWDFRLLLLLKDKGKGLFSKQYCTQQAQYCTQQAQYCTQQAQDWTQQAQDWTQRAQDWTQQAQDWTGTLDKMGLDKFLAYFEKNPNDYWADRNNVDAKIPMKEYALIK